MHDPPEINLKSHLSHCPVGQQTLILTATKYPYTFKSEVTGLAPMGREMRAVKIKIHHFSDSKQTALVNEGASDALSSSA